MRRASRLRQRARPAQVCRFSRALDAVGVGAAMSGWLSEVQLFDVGSVLRGSRRASGTAGDARSTGGPRNRRLNLAKNSCHQCPATGAVVSRCARACTGQSSTPIELYCQTRRAGGETPAPLNTDGLGFPRVSGPAWSPDLGFVRPSQVPSVSGRRSRSSSRAGSGRRRAPSRRRSQRPRTFPLAGPRVRGRSGCP